MDFKMSFRNGRDPTLWDLMTAKKEDKTHYIEPGKRVLVMKYKENNYYGDLLPNGLLKYGVNLYASPSAFAVAVIESVQRRQQLRTRYNTTADGWLTITYMGKTLAALREEAGLPVKRPKLSNAQKKIREDEIEAVQRREQERKDIRDDISTYRGLYLDRIAELPDRYKRINKYIEKFNMYTTRLRQFGEQLKRKPQRRPVGIDYKVPADDQIKFIKNRKTLRRLLAQLKGETNNGRKLIRDLNEDKAIIKEQIEVLKIILEKKRAASVVSEVSTMNKLKL
jgi:hypothetical protein